MFFCRPFPVRGFHSIVNFSVAVSVVSRRDSEADRISETVVCIGSDKHRSKSATQLRISTLHLNSLPIRAAREGLKRKSLQWHSFRQQVAVSSWVLRTQVLDSMQAGSRRWQRSVPKKDKDICSLLRKATHISAGHIDEFVSLGRSKVTRNKVPYRCSEQRALVLLSVPGVPYILFRNLGTRGREACVCGLEGSVPHPWRANQCQLYSPTAHTPPKAGLLTIDSSSGR